MTYSQFESLEQAIEAFDLTVVESVFFPIVAPVVPSNMLLTFLQRSVPIVSAASEKARSEGIIYPVLLEVRDLLDDQISLFSGQDFNVDSQVGLNGIVDFLICQSPIVSVPSAPVIVMVEAKKADIASGYGQCVAEMVAAVRFNQQKGKVNSKVYGCVTNGLLWRFLQLDQQTVTIDLTDYGLNPLGDLLAKLMWLAQSEADDRSDH